MNYFAYGSNMSIDRLRKRVPNARLIGTYALTKHDLRFHKASTDGSAKCDAYFTGLNTDVVEGVVFNIDTQDITLLDCAEGLGKGYKKKNIIVSNYKKDQLEAFTYTAICINDSLLPFSWYKYHVLVGANNAGLSPEYINKIKNTKSIKDTDYTREQLELAIYEQ